MAVIPGNIGADGSGGTTGPTGGGRYSHATQQYVEEIMREARNRAIGCGVTGRTGMSPHSPLKIALDATSQRGHR
jgi:hypothetical protein